MIQKHISFSRSQPHLKILLVVRLLLYINVCVRCLRYIFINLAAQQNISSQESIKQPLITPSYISITTLQTIMYMILISTILLVEQVNNNLL